MKKFLLLVVLLIANYCFSQEADKPFKQAVSVKYELAESLKGAQLKKVVVDYNNIIYVLSDRGLLRVHDRELIKDLRYAPLAGKIPVDITVQETSGHLYYLYSNKVLTNGYAGIPHKILTPGKFSMLAAAADGSVLLAGNSSAALLINNNLSEIKKPSDRFISIQVYNGNYYALSEKAVYKLVDNQFKEIHKGNNLKAMSFRNNEIILGTAKGYYGIKLFTGDSAFSLQTKLPVPDIDFLYTVKNNIWAATANGAYMHEGKGSYRYYASKRWLAENKVTSIASDNRGNIFLLSPSAVNEIQFIDETLVQKARLFQDNIRQRHIRYGFISEVTMEKPGDLSTAKMTDTDNDGLWSSFYLGSQAFRYAVTKEKEAKRYAWEAFEAFERILSVNPLKGFPARTFERKGFKYSDPERWHDSQDPEWEWKGTTSSDEFCGYIFTTALMNELVTETETEKKRVADFIDKILTHIIDNNYYFVDIDGKPTLWGRWNPEYINSFPETVQDRKLGSAHIIAGLQLGYALTGKEKYKTEAYKLIEQYGYLKNMQVSYTKIKETPGTIHMGVDLGSGGWNHSDDEMAFLTYWVLYRYAFTKELQKQYADIIHDHWEIEKPERNALWNLISYATCGSFDQASTLWHLREYPTDLVRWTITNSHRKDLVFLPDNFRKQYTKELLPPGETPMHRHNANPFELDGGNGGRTELAGDEYLLPYWMAKYLKVIE